MAGSTTARNALRAGILWAAGILGALWLLAAAVSHGPWLAALGEFFPGNIPEVDMPQKQGFEVARQSAAVYRDAQTVWAARFQAELGKVYEPAELVYFTRETPSPCAGALNAAGPFYCEKTRSATLDLAFLGSLGRYLHRHGELGAAMFVARVTATHAQAELGSLRAWRMASTGASRRAHQDLDLALALEADCLTGVWAHHAASRLGPIPDGFFGHMIATAREVAWNRPKGSVLPDAILLAPGTREDRDRAFSFGRETGLISACRAQD